MTEDNQPPGLIVADAEAWRRWLDANDETDGGVWLVLAKKGTTTPTSLTYDGALEEALCHGWIDGQVQRRDEATFKQRFTPRRQRSAWSKRNVEIVARLEAEGRMTPAGDAAVAAAKQDGRWERAYDGSASIEVPDDLRKALEAEPKAKEAFERLTSQNRYSILYRLHEAKRSETRAKRIVAYVEMLARGETIHPQRQDTR
ncbi:MAG TPA: YdeI/OmpD-associated family protein [Solirubrobacteraceae bacterium]|jgi:uncharacterized protein YdeI (YjbR/CyaY-like superfamily)